MPPIGCFFFLKKMGIIFGLCAGCGNLFDIVSPLVILFYHLSVSNPSSHVPMGQSISRRDAGGCLDFAGAVIVTMLSSQRLLLRLLELSEGMRSGSRMGDGSCIQHLVQIARHDWQYGVARPLMYHVGMSLRPLLECLDGRSSVKATSFSDGKVHNPLAFFHALVASSDDLRTLMGMVVGPHFCCAMPATWSAGRLTPGESMLKYVAGVEGPAL